MLVIFYKGTTSGDLINVLGVHLGSLNTTMELTCQMLWLVNYLEWSRGGAKSILWKGLYYLETCVSILYLMQNLIGNEMFKVYIPITLYNT
jgi:hypothetical protein